MDRYDGRLNIVIMWKSHGFVMLNIRDFKRPAFMINYLLTK
jgi:hypothetical protein